MLTDTGLAKTIDEIKNFIKSHESKYKEFVERFNTHLDILKSEFEKYPNFDRETVENSRYELENILEDFENSYIRPMESDPGTKPFNHIRGLLPHIDQYI